MVRVLAISLLAFAGLILVTQALPVQTQAPRSVTHSEPAASPETPSAPATTPASPFSTWEGVWLGTYNTYGMDGELIGSVERQIERLHADIGHDMTIRDMVGEESLFVLHAHQRFDSDSAESREADDRGGIRVVTGRRIGGAILWHHVDPDTGVRTAFREEVLPSGLYTVDGVGVTDGQVRLYEGRYRRVR
jgi:hypothetical protein